MPKVLATAASKDIVTPNVDTVYSQAFLDLNDTAMVYVKPQTDRFCSVEVMDAYTNAVSILGSGGDTQDQQIYLFTGPNYKGSVPDNMKTGFPAYQPVLDSDSGCLQRRG